MTDLSTIVKIKDWLKKKFENVLRTEDDLHEYQNVAVDFMYANPFSALFLDTGLGKTAALLKLIGMLVMREECGNVLIIAPQRVANVTWPDEIQEWLFSAWFTPTIIRDEELTEAIRQAGQRARVQAKLEGSTEAMVKLKVEEARHVAAKAHVRQMMFERPGTVYLIHKEQVEFLVDSFGREWPFDTVIIDESSSLKDHTTNRWKALWKIRLLVRRMHQLTATPTAEGYRFLFAQINLLDGGKRFGKNYNKFCKLYFDQCRYTRKWTIREGAEKAITDKIADICLVMKQEDYLDLQQPVTRKHKIYLSAKQMDQYRQMEKFFLMELEDGTEIEAETSAALSQKLMQMASGVVYDTVLVEDAEGNFKKKRNVHGLHDDKITKLRELQEELNGENMLVAYYHNSSLERILRAFPEAVAMDKAGKNIKKWQQGKIKMFLIHPQSDAHGLNLQKGGRHVVFFDIPWSYENYYQLYRRLARQGQQFLVVIHQLIAVGTIDEIVAQCLVEKRETQEVFFKLITAMRRRLKRMKAKASLMQLSLDDDL